MKNDNNDRESIHEKRNNIHVCEDDNEEEDSDKKKQYTRENKPRRLTRIRKFKKMIFGSWLKKLKEKTV